MPCPWEGDSALPPPTARPDSDDLQSLPEGAAGDHVVLSVSDTGVGMEEYLCTRIFEPFFTARGMGRGTGLGLSTVHGIVRQSGGQVTVTTSPGQGTTFRVYLPTAQQVPGIDTAPPIEAVAAGGETVLVVEDDPHIRTLTEIVLRRHGYNTLVADGGVEANRLSQTFQGCIHLLLTDILMPDADGREVARELTVARPDLRVLFMSGYPGGAPGDGAGLHADAQFLAKPFTPEALAARVRAVLDRGGPLPDGLVRERDP